MKENRTVQALHKLISYRRIFAISAPIMLGSAAQNVVALTDSVFLYYLGETEFAAIGFVGVYYLIIAAIGYGFSKGAQIFIARRNGELDRVGVRTHAQALFIVEILLSILFFFVVYFFSQYLFDWFLQEEDILIKSMEYIQYRIYGIFFGYLGIAIVSFYTGLARTKFILVDTAVLAIVNILLNYSLIFGKFGLPAMGIAGAGLASAVAEAIAFVVFVIYMIFDHKIRDLRLVKFRGVRWQILKDQLILSAPIVLQLLVGLGSWFVFFGVVENLGKTALAVSNLVRIVYLCLSIPVWGYSSAINTLVSQYIGEGRNIDVLPLIIKTGKLATWSVLIFAVPVILFPHFFLYPLLGTASPGLISEAQPILFILAGILFTMSIASIFYNGLTGTGAAAFGLRMQTFNAVVYVLLIHLVVNTFRLGLRWAWAVEIIYWLLTFAISIWYIQSKKWQNIRL